MNQQTGCLTVNSLFPDEADAYQDGWESSVYHCMTRIDGGDFFLEGDREKEVLRKQIWKVSAFCGVEVLTYCIMSNHFHVLVRTPHDDDVNEITDKELMRRVGCIYSADKVDFFRSRLELGGDVRRNFRANLLSRMGDVSLFMKELKQRFSIWYNKSHRRQGTLWGRAFQKCIGAGRSVRIDDDRLRTQFGARSLVIVDP